MASMLSVANQVTSTCSRISSAPCSQFPKARLTMGSCLSSDEKAPSQDKQGEKSSNVSSPPGTAPPGTAPPGTAPPAPSSTATAAAPKPVPEQETQQHSPPPGSSAPATGTSLGDVHVKVPELELDEKVHVFGAPRPPCEDERLASTLAFGKMDGQRDPEIAEILRVLADVFKVPSSLCTLFGQKNEEEPMSGWSLAFKHHMTLVIPDTLKDVRFEQNEKVIGPPYVRFYCGAPLVASNGHRLGTLCMTINNFSDLVVRLLEKDVALQSNVLDNNTAHNLLGRNVDAGSASVAGRTMDAFSASVAGRTMDAFSASVAGRTMDAFSASVALVDTSNYSWKLAFVNSQFCKLVGVERDDALTVGMSDLFETLDGGALPNAQFTAGAAEGRTFIGRVKSKTGKGAGKCFILRMSPSSKDFFDNSVLPIGVPATIPITGDMSSSSSSFYFATAVEMNDSSSADTPPSSIFVVQNLSPISAPPEDLEGLEMGHLLGQGSHGPVYYGTWYGSPVAVKIRQLPPVNSDTPVSGVQEAALSTNLRHPLIVTTLKGGGPSRRGERALRRDTPFLKAGDAIDRGWLTADNPADSMPRPSTPTPSTPTPNMEAIVATSLEIAVAVCYLHSKGIVHGDLSGWNCLLSSAGSTARVGGRNFVAKISDFGLSVALDVNSTIKACNYATLAHMPPEALLQGTISKATDVYSFGVLMWQMYTCSRPWCGLTHAQIVMQVGTKGASLVWPENSDASYRALAESCMVVEPGDRPPFVDAVSRLEAMQKEAPEAEEYEDRPSEDVTADC
eukprot:gene25632-11290_t